jgi:hypothetical protein
VLDSATLHGYARGDFSASRRNRINNKTNALDQSDVPPSRRVLDARGRRWRRYPSIVAFTSKP